jgi:cystathionine beta-lyase
MGGVNLSYPASPLTEFGLPVLRRRRSAKWATYPEDVLPLWVAEMDTPLAPPIRAALHEAVELGDTGYPHLGQLPEAYAEFSAGRFGWAPDPSHVWLVPDVMNGIVEVLRLFSAPGDGVVVNTPAYPPFFAFIAHAGRRVVESPLAVEHDGRYTLDFDRLAHDLAGENVTTYLLCNPHNPTGTVLQRSELLTVAELAARHRVRVLADEVHAPLTYPGSVHVPFLSLDPTAVAFVSASKAWNLPGLKAALAVAGRAAVADLTRLPVGVRYSAGLFGVIASQAAFREGGHWLEEVLAGLDANRRLLAELLATALPAIRYRPPDATYLAWLDCRDLGLGDDPAAYFERQARVALNAGPSFGAPGRGFVRLNLATAPVNLTDAVRRMSGALDGRVGPF